MNEEQAERLINAAVLAFLIWCVLVLLADAAWIAWLVAA